MCTVTYIPVKDKIFITHNRDEKGIRLKAIPPKEYIINGNKLLFPRDSQAGGTWIALKENGTAAVLLNGGFRKHQPRSYYRKSRGLAFLDIITTAEDSNFSYNKVNLSNIEPFTVIWLNQDGLYECRWDGDQKQVKQLNPAMAYSWSSVTLYDEEVIEKRNAWFKTWLLLHPEPVLQDIMEFHLFGGEGDAHNDLRMNRNGILLTVSITAMEISPGKSLMKYTDLLDNTISLQHLNFIKAPLT